MINDLVGELIARILAAAEAGPEEVKREEVRIRQQFGGGRHYFQKKAMPEGKAHTLGVSLAAGASIHEAFAAAGVSRATGYRLMRRRWR